MLRDLNTTDLLNSTFNLDCVHSSASAWILRVFTMINILFLLPLYVYVTILGCQRKRESSSAASSQSDVFMYNMVAMEMAQVLGCVCLCLGEHFDRTWVMLSSVTMLFKTFCIKILFQMLMCIELFVAVVYPVTYLRVKNSWGVRIRNVAIGLAWLLCVVWIISGFLERLHAFQILYFFLITLVLSVVTFCCVSVLWTLKRPVPGHHTGVSERVDQSKLRAFHTITTIVTVLWLSLGGVLILDALQASLDLKGNDSCVLTLSASLMSLPSSVVLPVMFLLRARKLPLHKN